MHIQSTAIPTASHLLASETQHQLDMEMKFLVLMSFIVCINCQSLEFPEACIGEFFGITENAATGLAILQECEGSGIELTSLSDVVGLIDQLASVHTGISGHLAM